MSIAPEYRQKVSPEHQYRAQMLLETGSRVEVRSAEEYSEPKNNVYDGIKQIILVDGIPCGAELYRPEHCITSPTKLSSKKPAYLILPESQEEALAQAEVIKHVLSVLGIDPERCQYKNMGKLAPKLPPARMAEHVCEKQPHPNDPKLIQVKITAHQAPRR